MTQNNQTKLRIIETEPFQRWMSRLQDRQARHLINARLSKIALGIINDADP